MVMSPGADDHHLMQRLAAGEEGALRVLMTRHQLRVFRFVQRRVANEAVAEELTNEVFMDAWRNAKTFEGRAQVGTWLLSIAHNRSISALRKRREEAWDEEKAATLMDGADDPEVAVQKDDKAAVLRRCLDKLTPDHREIIDLVYYQELSVAEVSAVVGIPEATAKTRLFYARKKLSEILKTAGIDRGWP
jgi:RNA polymerase sigma-70 factor (ECF subfamily)